MRELKALEADHPDLLTPDSPTQRVGGKPKEGFAKVPHSRPMLSLDNAYNEEELRDWDRRVRSLAGDDAESRYVCESSWTASHSLSSTTPAPNGTAHLAARPHARRRHHRRRRHHQCPHHPLRPSLRLRRES